MIDTKRDPMLFGKHLVYFFIKVEPIRGAHNIISF